MFQQSNSLGDTSHLPETSVEDYHYTYLMEGKSCAMVFVQSEM
jgi:hypothetical protein